MVLLSAEQVIAPAEAYPAPDNFVTDDLPSTAIVPAEAYPAPDTFVTDDLPSTAIGGISELFVGGNFVTDDLPSTAIVPAEAYPAQNDVRPIEASTNTDAPELSERLSKQSERFSKQSERLSKLYYYFGLERIDIPPELLQAYVSELKGIPLADACVYAEAYRNNDAVWASDRASISRNESAIMFGSKQKFLTPFKEGDTLDVKVFIAQRGAFDSRAKNVAAGVGSAAALGAGIGALITCWFDFGITGAAVGGAIGAAVGGGAGAIAPVEGAVEVSVFHYDDPNQFLGTKKESPRKRKGDIEEKSKTSVTSTGAKVSEKLKSANAENIEEMFTLGRCHYRGEQVTKNYVQAVYWFFVAAEAGHAEAMNNLGLCFAKGYGVDQDYEAAVYWY